MSGAVERIPRGAPACRESSDAEVVEIRVVGSLDLAAVVRIEREMAALPLGARVVVLDLSAARLVSRRTLCRLASALASVTGLHVVQKGLPRHEERILQYIGIGALRAAAERDDP